jgi:NAD-dependent dihydropyrimidine dehydrogenase PreA subunit
LIAHLRLAAERGLGRLDGFQILGEDPAALKCDFKLPAHPDLNRFVLGGLFMRTYGHLRRPLDRLLGRGLSRGSATVAVDTSKCDACAVCEKACPVEALRLEDKAPRIDDDLCIACFCCAEACPKGALSRA